MVGMVGRRCNQRRIVSLQGNTHHCDALYALLRARARGLYALAKTSVNKKLKKVDFTIFLSGYILYLCCIKLNSNLRVC